MELTDIQKIILLQCMDYVQNGPAGWEVISAADNVIDGGIGDAFYLEVARLKEVLKR